MPDNPLPALLQHPLNVTASCLLQRHPACERLYSLPILSLAAAGLPEYGETPESYEQWELLSQMAEMPRRAMAKLKELDPQELEDCAANSSRVSELIMNALEP